MQINKDYESEINLRDLFFHVHYRWRSILTAALIGAVLLGGYNDSKVSDFLRKLGIDQQIE